MSFFRRLLGTIRLTLYFLYDLLSSSVRIAYDVVTPSINSKPRLVVMPLDAKSDTEILLTANLISLTPGTLTVDVSEDRSCLLIHSMFDAKDNMDAVQPLKDGIEARVIGATR
ncbi:Na+/H+ antiporter subunit E [Oceanomicrobium pacificus]|uniref:Sodium:proton antiporter n=1 Tax=Oceanomicrobium pacificus TaxID=2692916 RepID=A0A6B0THJ0_9RHOB|nr:Na+/H+ antiporter subunit E [Oceanomicrobium pacificus]MXU63877.1 sodium:proton antiporter [Oceanomicrobium pacificus]